MARKRGPFKTFNRWVLGSICVVVLFWIVAIVIGFVWYPAVGGDLTAGAKGKPLGLFQLICGGLGFVNTRIYSQQPGPSPIVSSQLAWTDETLKQIQHGDVRRGAAISVNCISCHGPQGMSTADYIPNLAGLPREVIYKQLIDYRTSKRNYVMMNAIATSLSDRDIADVAAFYSSCPREELSNNRTAGTDEHIRRLFTDGDPMRNVVACAACHGPEGLKIGAPPLTGQRSQYLFNQLTAFSQKTRTNDINQQMRLVAAQLKPDEINRLAEYLGSKQPQTAGR
jgi:cytochrome c553